MKTVILVDDEELTRGHIREVFPWESWGYRVAGEAGNGQEALEMMRELTPDIALVDITMPVMNGLELLKQLSKESLDTKCVILTAHREFEYVKQALEFGASGYILKSPINLPDAKAALDKAMLESEKEVKARSAFRSQLAIQTNQYPLRKHFFRQLLTGVYDENQEIIDQGHSIGVNFQGAAYMLLLGQVDRIGQFQARYSERDLSLLEFSLLEIIRESLHSIDFAQVELFPLHYGKLAIVLNLNESMPGPEEITSMCRQVEQAIFPPLQAYFNLTMTLSASPIFANPAQIRTSFKQADGLFEHRFYQEKPGTLHGHGLQSFQNAGAEQSAALQQLAERLNEDFNAAERGLNSLKSFFYRYRPAPKEVLAFFASLEGKLRQNNGQPEWPNMTEDDTLNDLLEAVRNWLHNNHRQSAEAVLARPEIVRTIQYIREHIGEEITLEALSNAIGLSSSHLSYLFKKEIGKSVIDFVIEQRIELAKQYLTEGSYRNYELAEKVGFVHYSYFSNMFKKVTGMSPNEYKRSIRPQIHLKP
ncbi:response regulator [Paenibacillus pasadenensis]|uniref:response regulator transcription factor n=1 Tax=Paenibacillus pasadenensis TaxID=217090 RepID=UPI00203B4B6B|nr:response regulator [Paenibacillus pasadenensis]MCM3747012.1 response regulator [Paenibacillus pasadenensis]